MPPPFDQTSGLILLPAQLPKGKELEDPNKGVVDFRLSQKDLETAKKDLKLSPFISAQPQRILDDIYNGLKVKDSPEERKKINIIYWENKGLIREPATVLKEGRADCDEVTRTAYLLAWESGVTNIKMIEMKWTDPKTNERTGHSFIVLMPQEKDGIPRIYDLTYFKKGEPIAVESNKPADLEAAIRKEYATDAANPNFKIVVQGNLNEVEAAHYEWVGKYFAKHKKWQNAEEAYKHAVALEPQAFEYNWGLAVSYEEQDKWNEAVNFYEKCHNMEEGKNNPRVISALGVAYANTGQNDKAEQFLRMALELKPEKYLMHRIEQHLKTFESK